MQVFGEQGLQEAMDALERDLLVGWHRTAPWIDLRGARIVFLRLLQCLSVAQHKSNVERALPSFFVNAAPPSRFFFFIYPRTEMRGTLRFRPPVLPSAPVRPAAGADCFSLWRPARSVTGRWPFVTGVTGPASELRVELRKLPAFQCLDGGANGARRIAPVDRDPGLKQARQRASADPTDDHSAYPMLCKQTDHGQAAAFSVRRRRKDLHVGGGAAAESTRVNAAQWPKCSDIGASSPPGGSLGTAIRLSMASSP